MKPLARFLTFPERRPRATLAVAACVLVLAGLSVLRLRADASLAPLIPDGVPAAAALRTLSERFEVAERALVLVEAADATPGPRGRELLAFAQRLEAAIQADPAAGPLTRAVVIEPGADASTWVREEVLDAALGYLDAMALEELARRLSPAGLAERLGRLADLLASAAPGAQPAVAAAVADPVGVSELLAASSPRRTGRLDRSAFGAGPVISTDGRALLVQLVPAGRPGDLDAAAAFTAAVQAVMDAETRGAGAPRARLFGAPPTAAHNAASIRSDMTRSVAGSVILLQLMFLLAYRRLLAFPLAAIPLAAGLLAGFGVYACFRSTLTPLTAAAGAVLAGLGVDFAIHRLGHAGGDGPARSGNAALAGPMAAACGTSLVGFAAMGVSSVPAIRDFALVGALGLGGAWLAALTLLPAMMAFLERGAARPLAVRDVAGRRLAAAVGHRPRAAQGLALGLAAVLLAAAAWPTGGERFAHDLDALNPRPNPPLEAQRDAERRFPAADATMPVLVEAPDVASLLAVDAAVAAAARAVAPQLEAIAGGPVSLGVTGLSTLLPTGEGPVERSGVLALLEPATLRPALAHAAENAGFAPDAFDHAAGWLVSLADASAPDESALRRFPLLASTVLPHLNPPPAADRSGNRLAMATVRWTLPSTPRAAGGEDPGADGDVRGRVVDALGAAVDAVPGATATGLERGGRVIGDRLGGELGWMLGLAGVGVLAWLGLCFGSVSAVALVLVPPAAGVLAVLAAGNLLGVPLNLLSVLALPLLVGIGVDDGVFLVGQARRGQRGQTGAAGATTASLGNSLHAISVTTVSTAAGFGSLLLTSTPAIRALGGTLAVGVVACWLASVLFVLPRVHAGGRS